MLKLQRRGSTDQLQFERCVITKGVKTDSLRGEGLDLFERCVITKGVKTLTATKPPPGRFERCVITKGVKTILKWQGAVWVITL